MKQALTPPPARDWWGFFRLAYLAVVCFASGITFCVTLGSVGFNALVSIFPQLEVESREDFAPRPAPTGLEHLSAADQAALRAGEFANVSEYGWQIITQNRPDDITARKAERTHQVIWHSRRNMVESLMTLIISLLVFVFHWRLFKRSI